MLFGCVKLTLFARFSSRVKRSPQRRRAEQAARRRDDRVGRCHPEHSLGALAEEGQGRQGRQRLGGSLSASSSNRSVVFVVRDGRESRLRLISPTHTSQNKKIQGCFYSHPTSNNKINKRLCVCNVLFFWLFMNNLKN